jgi:hypothetical protein
MQHGQRAQCNEQQWVWQHCGLQDSRVSSILSVLHLQAHSIVFAAQWSGQEIKHACAASLPGSRPVSLACKATPPKSTCHPTLVALAERNASVGRSNGELTRRLMSKRCTLYI